MEKKTEVGLLIAEVFETCGVFPARRHGLVFGFGATTEKTRAGGNHGGLGTCHGTQATGTSVMVCLCLQSLRRLVCSFFY